VPGVPDAPQIGDITDTSIALSWQPPAKDGGSPIINYWLEHKLSSDLSWARVTTDQIVNAEYVVNKLRTGKGYDFRVAAENIAGVGKWSQPSKSTVCKAPLGRFILEYLASTLTMCPSSLS